MKFLRKLTQYMESGNALLQILLSDITPRALQELRGQKLILIPAALSLLRIPLGYILLLIANGPLWQQILVHFAAVTSDAYDGMLARRWNCTSRFGAVLDPLCDKIYIFWCAAAYWNKVDLKVFEPMIGLEAFLLLLQIFGFLYGWLAKKPFDDEDFKSHAWGKCKVTIQFLAFGAACLKIQWLAFVLSIAGIITCVGSVIEFNVKRAARLRAAAQKQA